MGEVLSEWYSIDLSIKMVAAKKKRAEKGLWNGNLPFGYAKGQDGLPLVVSEEAQIVRQVFQMYASGRYTYQTIAIWLNQTKYRPRVVRKDRKSRQYLWSKDTVKDMLRNPFYLGHVTHKGNLLPGKH
ncbi:recombinase family protein, partial [Chloroflexota bacterium]